MAKSTKVVKFDFKPTPGGFYDVPAEVLKKIRDDYARYEYTPASPNHFFQEYPTEVKPKDTVTEFTDEWYEKNKDSV